MSQTKKEASSDNTGKNDTERYEQHIGGFLNRWGKTQPAAAAKAAIQWMKTSTIATNWMRRWLAANVAKATEEMRQPVDVALVIHTDGWIDCYSKPYVRLHAYTMPYVDDVQLGEYLIECQMPERVREMYVPGMHHTTGGKIGSLQVRKYHACRGMGVEVLYSWRNCTGLWPPEDESHLEKYHQDGSGI